MQRLCTRFSIPLTFNLIKLELKKEGREKKERPRF